MSLKKWVWILLGIQFALGLGLAILISFLFLNEAELSRWQHVHFRSHGLVAELRQGMDDLTRLARGYVETGNEELARQYQALLDVRAGRRPRPVDPRPVHGDSVSSQRAGPHPEGETIALRNLMSRASFPEAEARRLFQALTLAEDLAQREEAAMNAARGLFDNGEGSFTVRKTPNRELAMTWLNDEDWLRRKAAVLRELDQFTNLFEQRTAWVAAQYEHRSLALLLSVGALIIVMMGLSGVSLLVINHQLTQRRRMEEELRESSNLLREAQVVASLGCYVLDIASGRWRSSDVMDTVFGIDAAYDRTVEGWMNLIHPDDRAMMTDYFRDDVLGRGRPFDKEYRIVRKNDQAELWVHGLGKLEFDAQGRPRKMYGTIQDVTGRRQAEAEHDRLQVQLIQAQKMESVGQLAGGVAHDFNNLLMGIMGYTDLCRAELPDDHPIRGHLDEIVTEVQRSADLTRQLLAFARRQTIDPKVLNLNEAVTSILKMLRRLIGENINLTWRPGTDLWPVKLDPSQIDQILTNLCVNARDAVAVGGTIVVETANGSLDQSYCSEHAGAVPGDYVMLAVSDDGRGMDPQTLKHVFEPFFTTKGVGKGTGLGLATVYGIVKQNKGYISAYSEPGRGTTFKVYLPRYEGTAVATPVQITTDVPLGHGEVVLVVEDEKSLRATCRQFLESLGYQVLVAESPDMALDMAAGYSGKIDLLLTDVVMPGSNGRELAERMGAVRPGLKCLYMSGYTADVIAHHGVLDEGTQFVSKPFTRDDLARKLHEILGKQD